MSHLRETIRTRSSRAILPDFGQTETGYEPCRARKTFQIKPGAEEISDDPVIGGLKATVSTLRLETIVVAVESAFKNRRNPPQTGPFLIPPAGRPSQPTTPPHLHSLPQQS